MSHDTRPSGRRAGRWWLVAGFGLLALLATITAIVVRAEWQYRQDQSRAEAIFELVQDRSPARPTATPGATAWLQLNIKRYADRIEDPDIAHLYRQIADWRTSGVPPVFSDIAQALDAVETNVDPKALRYVSAPEMEGDDVRSALAALHFRTQAYIAYDGRWLVVTRPKAVDASLSVDPESPSNQFLLSATPRLTRAMQRLDRNLGERPLPAMPVDRPLRLARVFALAQDSTLLSLPISDDPGSKPAALDEGREFRKLPTQPNFVANEFFFRFDFSNSEPQWHYSGLYLDLGGAGLVATITRPARLASDGFVGVLGVDISFDIDWNDFAGQVAPPLIAGVVSLPSPVAGRWQPWTEFAATAIHELDSSLRATITALARTERQQALYSDLALVHHGRVAGHGALTAFQVARATWLVVLFPDVQPPIAWIPMLLVFVLLGALLGALELNRRRARVAQTKAEFELQEKQNLLNTMQIPLVVTDPNTDEVVFGNDAAQDLGIVPGLSMGDLVVDDPRARAHYQKMQMVGRQHRRAYGLPLRVTGRHGLQDRYAVIRSVEVTAPIEALHADRRHRLGILFLLDAKADLALFTEDLIVASKATERRKLAGILNHGVDTFVQVLARLVNHPNGQGTNALIGWLSEYVERRLYVTAWLLDRWDIRPPLAPDSCIERFQVEATLARYNETFALVGTDRELRSRLHWDNGVLAVTPAKSVLDITVEWSDRFWFSVPVRGGFGFFLGEVLINAIRHGKPGSRPEVSLRLDRVRRELQFVVRNEIGSHARPLQEPQSDTYHGLAILRQLAGIFIWRDFQYYPDRTFFVVTWSIPVSERTSAAMAD